MDKDFNRAAIEAIKAARSEIEPIESQIERMYELGGELYRELRNKCLLPRAVCDINGERVAFWHVPHQADESGYSHHYFRLDAHGRFLLYVTDRQLINGIGWRGTIVVDRSALLHSDEYECARDKVTYVVQSLEWNLEEVRSGNSLDYR